MAGMFTLWFTLEGRTCRVDCYGIAAARAVWDAMEAAKYEMGCLRP